jgi:hypothetical protein
MPEATVSPLAAWETFYLLVGTSAAALTGLMFVVIALIADTGPRRSSPEGIAAYSTPTIVHFCVALLVSAILSAPWLQLVNLGFALGLCGAAALVYTAIVLRRARRLQGYRPVLEDWLWHVIFPFLAYTAILLSAIAISSYPVPALFPIGAACVLLVFIGIHNAWDIVTYITIKRAAPESEAQGSQSKET